MRERTDLAGRAVRPGRHDGCPPLVDTSSDEAAELGRHTRVAGEEAVEAERHRAADDICRERRSEPGGARGDERALERCLIRLADGRRGEIAEACRDAVRAAATGEMALERGPRRCDTLVGALSRNQRLAGDDPPIAGEIDPSRDAELDHQR